jgi:hypothetical protein
METTAAQPSFEVSFANFLDGWRAQWRYEPRWPSPGGADFPEFRVFLPVFHPARWRLGRAFYVRVGAPVLHRSGRVRDLPCYTVTPIEEPGRGEGFLFYDEDGRVSLRASLRAA